MSHPVPVAVDALLALLRTAQVGDGPLVGVRVDDGPVGGFDEPDAIGVGVGLDEVDALSSSPAYAPGSEQEPVDVQCLAQSWTGDADDAVWSRLRARVFELLDAVRELLAARRELGVACVWSAEIVRWSLSYARGERGEPMVMAAFTVRIQAYRRD